MEVFKDFLVNNYLWFLIISLILIFALIGYLADSKRKEDNGEGELKSKKEKKVKIVEEEKFLEEKKDKIPNVSLSEAVAEKKPDKKEKRVNENDDDLENVITYEDPVIIDDTKDSN